MLENIIFYISFGIIFLSICFLILLIIISFIREIRLHKILYSDTNKTQESNFIYSDREDIDHKYFLKVLKIIFKIIIKTFLRYYHFALHYILFFFLKIIDYISDMGNFLYEKMRDYFMQKSLEDKRYVKYFWKHLRQYKKERDSEEEKSDNQIAQ